MKKKIILAIMLPLALAACSINKTVSENLSKDPVRPLLSGENFKVFQCVRNKLKVNRSRPKLFLVSDIKDGTVTSTYNGTLSDSGSLQMKSSLAELIPRKAGLVSDLIPAIFRAGKGGGVNVYGSVHTKYLDTYSKSLQKVFAGKKPDYWLIKGAFTRFDENPKEESSKGFSAGNNGSDGDGDLSYGQASRKGSIALTINIVDPASQIIVTTQSFIADTENRERDLKIRVGPGEGALGYTNKFRKSLTPHEIQQHLIDVAALWIVNKTYGSMQIKSCLSNNKIKAITDIN